MYMFDLKWRYDRPILGPIIIKPVHSSYPYQWAIYQKYNRRGHESPSGYGALGGMPFDMNWTFFFQTSFSCRI